MLAGVGVFDIVRIAWWLWRRWKKERGVDEREAAGDPA